MAAAFVSSPLEVESQQAARGLDSRSAGPTLMRHLHGKSIWNIKPFAPPTGCEAFNNISLHIHLSGWISLSLCPSLSVPLSPSQTLQFQSDAGLDSSTSARVGG